MAASARTSAGLLMFRRRPGLEVFLVHPGGPFWARKDEAAWSIPKGEVTNDEDGPAAAMREFREETGFAVSGPLLPLGSVRQPGGKTVAAWAIEGDCDPSALRSNTFEMEWPPRSGRRQTFPEVDRGQWFTVDEARRRLHRGQQPLLDNLLRVLASS